MEIRRCHQERRAGREEAIGIDERSKSASAWISRYNGLLDTPPPPQQQTPIALDVDERKSKDSEMGKRIAQPYMTTTTIRTILGHAERNQPERSVSIRAKHCIAYDFLIALFLSPVRPGRDGTPLMRIPEPINNVYRRFCSITRKRGRKQIWSGKGFDCVR